MTPHYVTNPCSNCGTKFKQDNCLGDGHYCPVETQPKILGKDILIEDLRQKCVYNNTIKIEGGKAYWDYIQITHSKCKGYINEDCSKEAHEEIKLDWEATMKCVKDSFVGGQITYDAKNTALYWEGVYWKKYGPQFFPAVVINNRTYRGFLNPEPVYNTICQGFK